MKSNYDEKRKARIERYWDKARGAKKRSGDLAEQSHDMLGMIPMGQPILDAKDRRYREKIKVKMEQAIREDEKSKYYADKARAAERNTSISSDDPDAIRKLKEKLAEKEAEREQIKSANKKARSEGKPQAEWYVLPYLGKEIKRIKERIAKLEAMEQMENIEIKYDGFIYIENAQENRIQFIFDDMPDEKTRILLKKWSFKRTKSGIWQRFFNNNSRYAAKHVIEAIGAKRI